MYYPVYEEQILPNKLNQDAVDALYNLDFISYGADQDEPRGVVPYPEGLVSGLRRRYAFRDDAAVTDFLEKRPVLIQILFKAHKEIRDIFGTGPGLALRVVTDPEALEEQELFLFVQTKLHPRAARPLLDELGRKWWLGAMLDAKGEMNISLEYV